MKHRNGKLAFFFSIILVISSCEYILKDENFKDIPPPDGNHQFEVSLTPAHDTIMVFDSTGFNYKINTYGLKILEGEFSLGSRNWSIQSDTGTFSIAPLDFNPGYDSLGLIVFTNSGSGSIADSTGREGYIIEKHWFILIDGRAGPVLTPSAGITQDRYLKITWPKCEQYNFSTYEYSGVQITKTIKDADSTSYIDTSYVGGPADFRVNTRVITDNQLTFGNILSINDPYPAILFEESGPDSLRIFWNRSKYKCQYKLQEFEVTQFVTILESPADTSITIALPDPGSTGEYILYISPFHTDATNSHYIQQDHKYYSPGKNIVGARPYYGFNPGISNYLP